MPKHISPELPMYAWAIVAIGLLVLGMAVLKYPATNRPTGPSNMIMGWAFILCSALSAAYAVKLAYSRPPIVVAASASTTMLAGTASPKASQPV